MNCILAIDPGMTGALAFYIPVEAPERISVYDMPVVDGVVNPAELHDLIQQWKPSLGVVERVGPMPRDGVMQSWRFSSAYTTARVVLTLSAIPMVLVAPTVWKKEMKLPGGRDGKEKSRGLAIRLFPACANMFARKKDAGRAEAALIAYYYANTKGLLHAAAY